MFLVDRLVPVFQKTSFWFSRHVSRISSIYLFKVPDRIRYADGHETTGFHGLLCLLMRLSSPERNIDLEYKLKVILFGLKRFESKKNIFV